MLLLELLVIGWAIYQFCRLFEPAPGGGFEDEDLDLLYLAQAAENGGCNSDLFPHLRQFEETFVGTNLVSAEDMAQLYDAGYEPTDVEFMEPQELKAAMEDAGVDTLFYDFDE